MARDTEMVDEADKDFMVFANCIRRLVVSAKY